MSRMKLILRILINAVAIWLTALLIPNVELTNSIWGILLVAVLFGLVNALIRPIVKLFSLPITCLTLGLFTLVINTVMLLLTAFLAGNLLSIQGSVVEQLFWAFVASIVISIVSALLSWLMPD
jgi:putative membrane protein